MEPGGGGLVVNSVPVSLRPLLPGDGPVLAALFRSSIEVLAEEDYSEGQREAWAGAADDEAAFAKRLAGALTLVALVGGEPAGFASLAGKTIDMLYVAPEQARRGVATSLVDALERLATGRGVDKLTVDASDAARDFFAQRGFVPQTRKTLPHGEEWLGNTTMTRDLKPGSPS